LRRWLDAHPHTPVRLEEVCAPRREVCVVSAHLLVFFEKMALERGPSCSWLGRYRPVDRIGFSMYVYDFRSRETRFAAPSGGHPRQGELAGVHAASPSPIESPDARGSCATGPVTTRRCIRAIREGTALTRLGTSLGRPHRSRRGAMESFPKNK